MFQRLFIRKACNEVEFVAGRQYLYQIHEHKWLLRERTLSDPHWVPFSAKTGEGQLARTNK